MQDETSLRAEVVCQAMAHLGTPGLEGLDPKTVERCYQKVISKGQQEGHELNTPYAARSVLKVWQGSSCLWVLKVEKVSFNKMESQKILVTF